MTELAAFDLPSLDVATLVPETALDDVEQTTSDPGNATAAAEVVAAISAGGWVMP